MGVVFAAEQVRRRQAHFREAGTVGSAADDVVERFEAGCGDGFPRQFHRAHVVAEPIGHVAILLADLAANAGARFGGLQTTAQAFDDAALALQASHFEVAQDELHGCLFDFSFHPGWVNKSIAAACGLRGATFARQ